MTGAWYKRHGLCCLLLLMAVALVYGSALNHGFLSDWDDPAYVTANEAVKGFSVDHLRLAFTSFYMGNYAPLQILSYMLDYTLWGMKPAGFILGNILLHAGSGILFYILVIRLGGSRVAALAAAGLFLLHPVQVESVVWISQRKNVLAMCCFLLALHCYLGYREREAGKGGWYAGSLLFFFAALMAKTVAVVLPLVLFAYDFCFVPRERRGRWLADKLPYLAVAGVAALLAFYSQSAEFHGGKMGYLQDSPWLHLLTMLPVFARYLGLILWPTRLSAIYQPTLKFGLDGEVAASALLLFLIALGGVLLFRRRRELFFWYAVAIVGILPVSHVVPLTTFMNDRYLYFPMLGVAGLFGVLAARGEMLAGRAGRAGRLATVASLLLLVPLAVMAQARTGVWRNSRALWSDAVAKVPQSKEAWLFLAETIYLDSRDPAGSMGPYLRSMDLDPDYPFAKESVGTYGETGQLLRRHGDAVRRVRRNPEDAAALLVMAEGHARAGNRAEARALFRRVLVLDPTCAEARQQLEMPAEGEGR